MQASYSTDMPGPWVRVPYVALAGGAAALTYTAAVTAYTRWGERPSDAGIAAMVATPVVFLIAMVIGSRAIGAMGAAPVQLLGCLAVVAGLAVLGFSFGVRAYWPTAIAAGAGLFAASGAPGGSLRATLYISMLLVIAAIVVVAAPLAVVVATAAATGNDARQGFAVASMFAVGFVVFAALRMMRARVMTWVAFGLLALLTVPAMMSFVLGIYALGPPLMIAGGIASWCVDGMVVTTDDDVTS